MAKSKNNSDTQLIKLLNGVLADTYVLAVKTHGFHWNVTGETFAQLHALFATQYEELTGAADEIAERIRALNYNVDASMAVFLLQSVIKEETQTSNDAKAMIKTLIKDHTAIRKRLVAVVDEADDVDDDGTEDLAIGRMRAHDKTIWMLRSLVE